MKNFLLTALCVLCVTAVNLSAAVTIPWGDVDKTGATLADLPTRNWSDLQSKPTTAAGLGLVSGSNLDAWAAKTLPTGPVVGTTDTQTLTNKDLSAATNVLRDATTSVKGVVQLADTATGLAGTDASKVPPVATVQSMLTYATATRANAPYLRSDGATAGRGIVWTPGAAGNVAAQPATFLVSGGIVAASPPANFVPAYLGSKSSGIGAADPNRFSIYQLSAGGALRIAEDGATFGTDYRRFDYAGFGAAFAGQPWQLCVSFAAGNSTANPVVTWGGVDITSRFTLTTGGTAPNWLDAGMSCAYFQGSNTAPAGRTPIASYYVGAWSVTEALAFAQTGLLPDWCQLTGSAISKIPSGSRAAYGAADGTTGYSASGSGGAVPSNTSVAGARDGGAGAYVWEFTSTGAGSGFSTFNFSLEKYRPYFVRVWARRTAGTVTTLSFGSINQGAGTYTLPGLTTSWQQFSLVMYALVANGEFSVGFGNAGGVGDKFQLDDLEIYPMGPVIRPTIQPGGVNGGVIHDLGDNHLDGVYTAGVTPITDATRGSITATLTWAGTHEAKALLADQALLPPNARIDSITVTASAATSGSGCTLNDGDTTSWWAAAIALSANTKTDITPAHRFPASSAVADLKIQVDPDTANYTGSITATINYSLAN